MPPPVDPSALQRSELEARLIGLLSEASDLKTVVAAQRDEIARLKGLKGRPNLAPSGKAKATEPKRDGKAAKRPALASGAR